MTWKELQVAKSIGPEGETVSPEGREIAGDMQEFLSRAFTIAYTVPDIAKTRNRYGLLNEGKELKKLLAGRIA